MNVKVHTGTRVKTHSDDEAKNAIQKRHSLHHPLLLHLIIRVLNSRIV